MTEQTEEQIHMILPQIIHLYFSRAYTLMEEINVHPGQVPLLFCLRKKDGCSQRELVEMLHVKPPTVTVTLNRMAKNEMVERRADPIDQRVSRIFITETGRAAAAKVELILAKIEEELFKGFTNEEILLMKRLLRQIKGNLYEACGEPENGPCRERRRERFHDRHGPGAPMHPPF